MNDEDYDKPYSSGSYKRSYYDEDTDYWTSYSEPDSKPESAILQSYYDDDDFNLDKIIDESPSKPSLEKEVDDAWEDDYDPWDPDDEDEEEDLDTTMLSGDFHLGSEINAYLSPKSTNQEILDWAKDRPGVNESSYKETVAAYQQEQDKAAQKMKRKILDGLEDAFSSRSKLLPPQQENILDPLPPVTTLIDERVMFPKFKPSVRVQLSRSKADVLYDRLRNGDTTEPVTWLGQDMLDRIGFEELCELINIDVDPESEAGEFLQELRDTYVSMIDDIMRLASLMDKNLGIPRHQGKFEDPRSYAVVKNYKDLVASKSKEELENLAFEFTGDEDAEYVEKISEAVFESLNLIFKKASGWGNEDEEDF